MLIAARKRNQAGFTLIEITIVIVAVAFLILGILKAGDVVRSGRLTKTITDLKKYESSTQAFKTKFLFFPGDMNDARARLANCAAPDCFNGNSDGIIGNQNTTASADQTGAASPGRETTMFWKHLFKANFIEGIEPFALPANPLAGSTHPQTPIGGAYSVYHRGNAHGISLKACPNSSVCGVAFMEPKDVFYIDQKLDGDANAATGTIIAGSGGCNPTTGVYDMDGGPCHMLYTMNEL